MVGYEVFRGIMVEDLMVGLVKDLTVCFVNFHILCCLSLFCWVVYFGLFGYTKKNDSICDGGNDGFCGLLKEVARYFFFKTNFQF